MRIVEKDKKALLHALGGDEGLLMFTAWIWDKSERGTQPFVMVDEEAGEQHTFHKVNLKQIAAQAKISKRRVRAVLDALVVTLNDPDFPGVGGLRQ